MAGFDDPQVVGAPGSVNRASMTAAEHQSNDLVHFAVYVMGNQLYNSYRADTLKLLMGNEKFRKCGSAWATADLEAMWDQCKLTSTYKISMLLKNREIAEAEARNELRECLQQFGAFNAVVTQSQVSDFEDNIDGYSAALAGLVSTLTRSINNKLMYLSVKGIDRSASTWRLVNFRDGTTWGEWSDVLLGLSERLDIATARKIKPFAPSELQDIAAQIKNTPSGVPLSVLQLSFSGNPDCFFEDGTVRTDMVVTSICANLPVVGIVTGKVVVFTDRRLISTAHDWLSIVFRKVELLDCDTLPKKEKGSRNTPHWIESSMESCSVARS
jgi:hypothetical protein